MDANTSQSPTLALLEQIKKLQQWQLQQASEYGSCSSDDIIDEGARYCSNPSSPTLRTRAYTGADDAECIPVVSTGDHYIIEHEEPAAGDIVDERECSFVCVEPQPIKEASPAKFLKPVKEKSPAKFMDPVDSLPVKGIPRTKKFNDYIEEKIISNTELENGDHNITSNKRKFLKRGEGLRNVKKYGRIKLKSKALTGKSNSKPPVKSGHNIEQTLGVDIIAEGGGANYNSAGTVNRTNVLLKKATFVPKPPRVPIKRLNLAEETSNNVASNSAVVKYSASRSSSISSEPHTLEIEDQELSAFEHLEELADNTSFSSNSSVVKKLLQKGLRSTSSPKLQRYDNSCKVSLLSKFEEVENVSSPQNEISNLVTNARELIQKEGHNISCTDDEIYAALQCISSNPDFTLDKVKDLLVNYHEDLLNTPINQQNISEEARPRVHFDRAEVLEFDVFEQDETLTDAPSMEEESDVVSLDDLQQVMTVADSHAGGENSQQYSGCTSNVLINPAPYINVPESNTVNDHITQLNNKGQTLLTFSPPKIPPDAPSHLIWSVFSKDKKPEERKAGKSKQLQEQSCEQVKQHKVISKQSSELQTSKNIKNNTDIEAHKILLVAKMKELEEEINIYKDKSAELDYMQQSILEEKQKLAEQRTEFLRHKTEEMRKLKLEFDNERFKLWREIQGGKKDIISSSEAKIITQENKDLKEQISELEEKLIKKDSSSQFEMKKLNKKIKQLEVDNRNLKSKVASLQSLEKENLNLKCQLDRKTKFNPRPRPALNPKKTDNIKHKQAEGKLLEKERKTTSSEQFESPDLSQSRNMSIVEVYPSKSIDFQETSSKKLDLLTSPEYTRRLNEINNAIQPKDGVLVSDSFLQHNLTPRAFNTPASLQSFGGSTVSPPERLSSDCTEIQNEDGTREVIYSNGNRKVIYSSSSYKMHYYNGDIKQVYPDKTTYIYGNDKTAQTTYPDGKQVLEFLNGQVEITYPDGSCEIRFPDKSVQHISTDGKEVLIFPDGTISSTAEDGSKVMEFSNGQKEIHRSDDSKERVYPDGTVKIMYPDGKLETRYSYGRVRVRDKAGNLIYDNYTSK